MAVTHYQSNRDSLVSPVAARGAFGHVQKTVTADLSDLGLFV